MIRARAASASIGFACLLIGFLVPALEAQAERGGGRNAVCEGTLDTGSGLAGSTIGESCSLAADSDEERRVQEVCGLQSTCRVEAIVRDTRDGFARIVKVIGVRQIAAAPSTQRAYLKEVAAHIDGILAPAEAGCGNTQDTPQDRVSVLLDGRAPAAIQLFARYCAVTSGSGDPPSESGFQATLRAQCGPVGTSDEALRSGQAGSKTEIVIVLAKDRPVTVDGESLTRCPIRQAYTPSWWIESSHVFRGQFPN